MSIIGDVSGEVRVVALELVLQVLWVGRLDCVLQLNVDGRLGGGGVAANLVVVAPRRDV